MKMFKIPLDDVLALIKDVEILSRVEVKTRMSQKEIDSLVERLIEEIYVSLTDEGGEHFFEISVGSERSEFDLICDYVENNKAE